MTNLLSHGQNTRSQAGGSRLSTWHISQDGLFCTHLSQNATDYIASMTEVDTKTSPPYPCKITYLECVENTQINTQMTSTQHISLVLTLDNIYVNIIGVLYQAPLTNELICEAPLYTTEQQTLPIKKRMLGSVAAAAYDNQHQLITRNIASIRLHGHTGFALLDYSTSDELCPRLLHALETCTVVKHNISINTTDGQKQYQLCLEKIDLPEGHGFLVTETPLQNNASIMSAQYAMDQLLEHTPIAVLHINNGIKKANAFAEKFLGYSNDELVGVCLSELFLTYNDYLESIDVIQQHFDNHCPCSFDIELKRKNNSPIWSNICAQHTDYDDAKDLVLVIQDISERKQSEALLTETLSEQKLVLENVLAGISFVRNSHFVRCNERMSKMLETSPENLVGSHMSEWFPHPQLFEEQFLKVFHGLQEEGTWHGELEMKLGNGNVRWFAANGKALNRDDIKQGMIWVVQDIHDRKKAESELQRLNNELEQRVNERTKELNNTVHKLNIEITERKLAEERTRHLAHHDTLTGLGNRTLLALKLDKFISEAENHGHQVAMMFIDLDRFKQINDSLGHAIGDAVLKEIAIRLRSSIREDDIVCRLGGDEFIIVLPNIDEPFMINRIAQRVLEVMTHTIAIAHYKLHVSASVGISIFPDNGDSLDTLMRHADVAMYTAKDNGRNNFRFYNETMSRHSIERMQLENDLHHAIEHDELTVYYQPKIDVKSRAIVGAEALVRWRHPERGLVSPAVFIPIAEETGLIDVIGQIVLEKAIGQNAQWHRDKLWNQAIAVNLSPRQLHDNALLGRIIDTLSSKKLNPHALELEITESMLMQNAEDAAVILSKLHDIGVSIAIDDFGTGYSSLGYLKNFSVDCLKIDRSFIKDIETKPDDAAITAAIISLGHSLNLKVVAEGIETQPQLDFLKKHNCDVYQGFYFSPAIDEMAFTHLLSNTLIPLPPTNRMIKL